MNPIPASTLALLATDPAAKCLSVLWKEPTGTPVGSWEEFMHQDLEAVCQQICDAYRPEDLFGVEEALLPPETMLAFLEQGYRAFKAPLDSGLDDLEFHDMADEALQKLENLYERARLKIARFHYGMFGFNQPRPLLKKEFPIGANRYLVGPRLQQTDAVDVFQGFLEREGEYLGEVEIKLANDASHNHYLIREARAIDLLHRDHVPQWKHLPFLLDRFEAAGRIGLVFRKTYGLSLATVRKKRAQLKGVDQRHIIWMLGRTLSALGYVHRCGLVHGALAPDTIVINDRQHNASLIEWGSSVHNPGRTGEKVLYSDAQHNPFLAPEVIAKDKIGPWSDIYALGKTMIWCIGGDPVTNSIPQRIEEDISEFLLRMVQEDQHSRSNDCWDLYEEQRRIRDALWPKQFLHLDIS